MNQKKFNQVYFKEKNDIDLQSENIKKIIKNQTIFHSRFTQIVNWQISSHDLKITGENFQEAIDFSEQIEEEPKFLTTNELIQGQKNYFVISIKDSVPNHINKHFKTENFGKTIQRTNLFY